MSIASNLYAEKIYAEHPNALWALDEKCDFVSYISDDLTSWTISSGSNTTTSSVVTGSSAKNSPVKDSKTIFFNATDDSNSVTFSSPSFTPGATGLFTTSFYFLSIGDRVTNVKVGYKIGSGSVTYISGDAGTSVVDINSWTQIYRTFSFTSTQGSTQIVVTVEYGGTTTSEYDFYVNNFSIGQNTEEFFSESSGVTLEELPSTILGANVYGIEAKQYGSEDKPGYYIANNTTKTLYAKNYGIPLVYGASNTTIIKRNTTSSLASLVVPGYGFMNKSASNQKLVFEAWLRIPSKSVSATPRRLFGPTTTKDGIYAYGPHLVLRIGNNVKSHYVGEWGRPMLIQIELDNGRSSVFLNGELIISDTYITDSFSEIVSDYIGFYAYTDIESIEIDCVAIYPYKISKPIALRRFGYGQAAKLPENITTAYGGTQIDIAYEKAGYRNVQTYPNWKLTSYKENVSTNTQVLSNPNFSFPEIILSKTFGKDDLDSSVWKEDLTIAQNDTSRAFIKMRPTTEDRDWSTIHGYLYLDSISLFGAGSNTKLIYGSFTTPTTIEDREQVLIKLQNKNNGDNMFVSISKYDADEFIVNYRYKVGSDSGTFATGVRISANTDFVIGLDLYATAFQQLPINSLISNINSLEMFIGGDYAGEDDQVSTTFDGNIYYIGICTKNNRSLITSISTMFSNGVISNILSSTYKTSLNNHTASYRILNNRIIYGENVYGLDINTKSIFTDYHSMKSLSKTVNKEGSESYDIDFIQFNINSLNVSNNFVKTYVAFDYTNNDLKPHSSQYTVTASVSSNKVVIADDGNGTLGSDWTNTKYEVVDGSIIYVPKNIPTGKTIYDLKIIVYVEIICFGINTLPIKIKSMKLTPVSLNSTINTIGTKNGIKIHPKSYEPDHTYDGYAPYSIGESNASYLYLTNKTGIKLLDPYKTDKNNNIVFPINENWNGEEFYINSFSLVSMIDENIPTGKNKIFEIVGEGLSLSIYLTRFDGISGTITNRGKITIEDSYGNEYSNALFYINGIYSSIPTITINEWNLISILLIVPVRFKSDSQFISTGPMIVNSFSYYKVESSKLEEQFVTKVWNSLEPLWGDVDNGTWNTVLVELKSVPPGFTPKTTYSLYTGTNKVFTTSDVDYSGLWLKGYQYSLYQNGIWQQSVLPAI